MNLERRKTILSEYEQKELEETNKFKNLTANETISPIVNRGYLPNASPITNLIAQDRILKQNNEKTSTVKKMEFEQSKQIKNFFKDKDAFGKIRNSPSSKKNWSYLKSPGILIKDDDKNVFHKNGMEMINERISGLSFYKIFVFSIFVGLILYFGVFIYHFFKAEPFIFCDGLKKTKGDCEACPSNADCSNGLLVNMNYS